MAYNPLNPYQPINSTNYEHASDPAVNDIHQAMDYDPYGRPVLRIDNTTVQHTSKNRVKSSDQEIMYFNTYQYTTDTNVWDDAITGTAAANFNSYTGNVELTVGSAAGDQIIRQSRRIIRYIPGRQSEITFAVKFEAPVLGVRKRLGLFDAEDGFYFEDGGDMNYYMVIRRNTPSGVQEDRIARQDWNVDRLDGTGPSGITADPTKQQMVCMEYEWYGAGQVEINWIYNNNKYPIHRYNTANELDRTWCSTPFLPVRYEVTNVTGAAGTHRLHLGSTSILAEGLSTLIGREVNANSPITGKTTAAANTFYPILSIRLKSNRLRGVVIPIDLQAATIDNTTIFYRLVLNPTLTNANWTSVSTESFVEYDVSATATTGGQIWKTGFLSSGNQGDLMHFDPKTNPQLGRSAMGTVSDILTIEIACTQANKAAFASMNWIELR